MRRLAQLVLDLLFPQTCAACAMPSGRDSLCAACLSEIPAVGTPLCPICGRAFPGAGSDHPCSSCLQRPPRFTRARACATYGQTLPDAGVLATAIQRFKYERDVTLGPMLGRLLAERCPFDAGYDLIAPVPLHRDRLRWRGFNQAAVLARPLANRWGIRVEPQALVRRRPTVPQVGLRHTERQRNVVGAFVVRRPASVHNRRVLLVDDVLTTGATVNECARELRRAGARQVDVLVLARAMLA